MNRLEKSVQIFFQKIRKGYFEGVHRIWEKQTRLLVVESVVNRW